MTATLPAATRNMFIDGRISCYSHVRIASHPLRREEAHSPLAVCSDRLNQFHLVVSPTTRLYPPCLHGAGDDMRRGYLYHVPGSMALALRPP
jgi:hypothetical protein